MTVWQSPMELGDEKASYHLFLNDANGNTTHQYMGPSPVYESYTRAVFEGQHRVEYYNRFVNMTWELVTDKQWKEISKC